MTNKLTDEQIAEGLRLAGEATPGPWEWGHGGLSKDLAILRAPSGEVCNFGNCETFYPTEGTEPSAADKALIAHAGTHYAAALRDLQEAKRLAEFWESEAARNHRDAQFYRGIVTETGELLGPECKRSDDGSMQGEPLVLKVTELVAAALREVQALRQQTCETCVHFCGAIHNMNECLHPKMVPMVPAVIDDKPFGCPGHKRREASQ